MPRISENQKESRIERIRLLLHRYPDGLTEAEIAKTLQIERRSVNNYLQEMRARGLVEKDGRDWYLFSENEMVLRKLSVTPEEGMALYLAARLFVKHSDQRNETAETILHKLATMLSSDAGVSDDIQAAAQELARRPHVEGYEDVFRVVMRSYIYRHKLQLVYHPYRGKPFETTFSPYLLEPSAIGFATYAIGHSTAPNALRTYKIERIAAAKITREEYEVPADFPGLALLRDAWSIYHGSETVRVVLRFAPDVARRVQETRWHPSQQLTWDEDRPGHLLLAVDIANTTDLIPWVRGWGAQCEVLEPAKLREQMMGEARALAHVYGWRTTTANTANNGPDHSRFNDIFGR